MKKKESDNKQLGISFERASEGSAHECATLPVSSSWPRTPAFHAGNQDSNSCTGASLPEFYPELVAKIRARLVPAGDGSGCVLWTGAASRKGYGRINFRKRLWSPHRVMLEAGLGHALPRHIDTCHRCDRPRCCAAGHLFAGTRAVNAQDAVAKGRMRPPKPRRALDEARVVDLFAAHAAGKTTRQLAAEFNLAKSAVHRILTGQTYANLTSSSARRSA